MTLARRADDLTTRPARNGGTVYTATATAGEAFDAAPTAADRASGGARDREVELRIIVGRDGLIRSAQVAATDEIMTTVYTDLNEQQAIDRPSVHGIR